MAKKSDIKEVAPFAQRVSGSPIKFIDRAATIAGAVGKHADEASKAQGRFVAANAARRKFDDPNGQHAEKVAIQDEIARCPERAAELADRLARHREIWTSERVATKEPVFAAGRELAGIAFKFLSGAIDDIDDALAREAAAWQGYCDAFGGNPGRVESEAGAQLRLYQEELKARRNVAHQGHTEGNSLKEFRGGDYWFGPAELGMLEAAATGEGAE